MLGRHTSDLTSAAAATDMAGAATSRRNPEFPVIRGQRVTLTRGHTGETGFPP